MDKPIKFRVDSALLDELGQRLVGKPSIALAEMVKNSYDADATLVKVSVDTRGQGRIVIRDNGHGMTPADFENFWMSVGTTHKTARRVSPKLKRPLTGSKGVGRISARLLSREIMIETVGTPRTGEAAELLTATLDWEAARESSDSLTEVEVPVHWEDAADATTYTKITLEGLRTEWDAKSLAELAKEIWFLQPPFDLGESGAKQAFRVEFRSQEEDLTRAFHEQVSAIKNIWHARIRGRIEGRQNKVSLEFRDGERYAESFAVEVWDTALDGIDYEILIYYFKGRQPMGVKVGVARDYIKDFAGVHIFDRGFRLPFYGEYKADWLRLVEDQSRSLTTSKLLPPELQVERGLLHLPHLRNVIGAVHVRSAPESGIEVTIQRDRLKDSPAFDQLVRCVRTPIDWYAQVQSTKLFERIEVLSEKGDVKSTVAQAERVLVKHEAAIPQPILAEIRTTFRKSAQASEALLERTTTQVAALGSLATAGISALAFQHEFMKQIAAVRRLVARLEEVGGKGPHLDEVRVVAGDLKAWIDRTNSLFALLSHLREAEHVTVEKPYPARLVVEETWKQVEGLIEGVSFSNSVPGGILLPRATFAEWTSVLQNIFYNALNAMLDENDKRLTVTLKQDKGRTVHLQVSDSGSGVDVDSSEDLFRPFVRRMRVTKERAALQLGGTGLGLAIVRMIAEHRKATVRFVEPETAFATTIDISWEQ